MLKKIFPVIAVLSLGFILNCGAKLDSGGFSPMSMLSIGSGLPSIIIPPTITSISPNSGESGGSVVITITGTNFLTSPAPPTVRLTLGGASSISPTFVTTVTATTITCMFNLGGAAVGNWNVVVTNPDGGMATLTGGFRVFALPGGLAAWWPLDSDFIDAVAGNNGAPSGTINFVDDRHNINGSAASCGAMMNKVIAPIAAGSGVPYGNSQRTMMAWVKVDALHTLGNSLNYLFGYGVSPELFTMYIYRVAPNSGILVFDGGGGNLVEGTTLLHTGQWYHIAVTYDGGTLISFYINGALDVSGPIPAALNTDDGTNVQMFQYGSFVPWLEGSLDDVRIYGSALSQTDIQTLAGNAGYLVPPQNFDATRGTLPLPVRVTLTWDPVLDATEYDIYRSSTLAGPYVKINTGTVTSTTYNDDTVSNETIYYYAAKAKNSSTESEYSSMAIGYWGTPAAIFTESFPDPPGNYDAWWDYFEARNTAYAIDFSGDRTGTVGSNGLTAGPSGCTGGCGFANEVRFTKDFTLTPITYFALNMWFYRDTMNGGEVKVYVNDPDPIDDSHMVQFFNSTQPAGSWIQRSLFYVGDPGSITSITILFYDITDSNFYRADDIVIVYK